MLINVNLANTKLAAELRKKTRTFIAGLLVNLLPMFERRRLISGWPPFVMNLFERPACWETQSSKIRRFLLLLSSLNDWSPVSNAFENSATANNCTKYKNFIYRCVVGLLGGSPVSLASSLLSSIKVVRSLV